MSTQEARELLELLQGTLDLLILRTLVFGPQHGQCIARSIQQTSEEALLVEHRALYPALQRLEAQGWVASPLGNFGEQPESSLLYSDPGWAKTACQRKHSLEAARDGYRKDSGTGGQGGLELCSDASGQRATSMLKLRPICSWRSSGCRKRA